MVDGGGGGLETTESVSGGDNLTRPLEKWVRVKGHRHSNIKSTLQETAWGIRPAHSSIMFPKYTHKYTALSYAFKTTNAYDSYSP